MRKKCVQITPGQERESDLHNQADGRSDRYPWVKARHQYE
jgi:hypothetical protein